MTDNSGLKVGLGVTALGAAGALSVKPIINKMTKFAANNTRKIMANNNKIINDLKILSHPLCPHPDILASERVQDAINACKEMNKREYENIEKMFKFRKEVKTINFLKPLAIAVTMYLACGAIVDWANRKQRANSEPNATTKNGNEYTKVNMGKKLGAVLGAAAYTISGIVNKGQLKKVLATSPNKAVTIISTAVTGMVGGTILGAIADKLSNKQAAKEADRNA